MRKIFSISFIFILILSIINCSVFFENEDSDLLPLLLLANSASSCKGDIAYDVIFKAKWSSSTHSGGTLGFPEGAHFSPVIGTTHNSKSTYWNSGSVASSGIEDMAETGSTSSLKNEFAASNSSGCIINFSSSVKSSPGSISSFRISRDTPLVTMATMIAPSPDWFIGVSNLGLLANNQFVESKTVDLFAYDAGTDDGATFKAVNSNTDPKDPISLITTTPLTGVSMGSFTFIKR